MHAHAHGTHRTGAQACLQSDCVMFLCTLMHMEHIEQVRRLVCDLTVLRFVHAHAHGTHRTGAWACLRSDCVTFLCTLMHMEHIEQVRGLVCVPSVSHPVCDARLCGGRGVMPGVMVGCVMFGV